MCSILIISLHHLQRPLYICTRTVNICFLTKHVHILVFINVSDISYIYIYSRCLMVGSLLKYVNYIMFWWSTGSRHMLRVQFALIEFHCLFGLFEEHFWLKFKEGPISIYRQIICISMPLRCRVRYIYNNTFFPSDNKLLGVR